MSPDAPVKRGPGRPRLHPRKQTMEPAIVAEAAKTVEANPRGAPETVPAPEVATEVATEVIDEEGDAMPQAVMQVAAPLPPRVGRPCSLDDAPVGSKIVVSKDTDSVKRVNMTTPNDVILLPSDDVAYTLPVGAKIRRTMPSIFHATELNPSAFYPVLVTSTARDAVERYRDHFHKND